MCYLLLAGDYKRIGEPVISEFSLVSCFQWPFMSAVATGRIKRD